MEDLIEGLTEKFKNSCTDETLGERLASEFKKILEGIQEKFEQKNYDYSRIEKTLNDITEEWCNLSLEEKQSRLFRDENFGEILQISEQAYQDAIRQLQGFENDRTFNIEEKEQRLKDLLKEVKPYNERMAKRYVSEGLLDLNFIKNPNTDIVSLRLGHILRSRNYIKNEEGR